MATSVKIVTLGLLFIVQHSHGFGLFDDFLGNAGQCEELCSNTYPLHTYEKGIHLGYCNRGCRLFNIIDFMNEDDNLNTTRDSCANSCQEAHSDDEDIDACVMGCDAQVNAAAKRKQQFAQMDDLQPPQDMLAPVFFVHNLYNSMVDRLNQHASISWSYFMQNNNGQIVVVKSGPVIQTDRVGTMLGDDEDELFEDDYKTSNYIETNLAPVDNSITPNVKQNVIQSVKHPLDVDFNSELDNINFASNFGRGRDEQTQDWLGCISRKTGIPRLLLSLTIFVSAIVMIWLCFTTAATAPEHKVHQQQKISIYGDLDYLSQLNMDDKALLTNIHPQDKMEASPLPIKIKVERI